MDLREQDNAHICWLWPRWTRQVVYCLVRGLRWVLLEPPQGSLEKQDTPVLQGSSKWQGEPWARKWRSRDSMQLNPVCCAPGRPNWVTVLSRMSLVLLHNPPPQGPGLLRGSRDSHELQTVKSGDSMQLISVSYWFVFQVDCTRF